MNRNELSIIRRIENLPPDISTSEAEFFNSLPMNDVQRTLSQLMYESKDSMIRSRAFDGLMKLNEFDKVGFLINLFDTHEIDWGNACCDRLLNFKEDPRAVMKLCSIALQSKDPDIRYHALESLLIIKEKSILPTLYLVFENDNGSDYEGNSIKELAKKAIDVLESI